MSGSVRGLDGDVARNVVAIFHASFHPTKGNVIDWILKAADDVSVDGVEFSVLPSGLHLVERDTVYFSHGAHAGIAVFRRRPTRAATHRGFRLASLGVLLQAAPCPRPWLLSTPLRALADSIYASAEAREAAHHGSGDEAAIAEADLLGLHAPGGSNLDAGSDGDLIDKDFAPARDWFEQRRAKVLTSSETWAGWSDELDGPHSSRSTPTQHLPHLLRILGLSALTLYKCVLARRRVLLFTLPPVEVAGVLAWVAADLCRDHHMAPRATALGVPVDRLFNAPKSEETYDPPSESPRMLGMVTLSDLARLEAESASGRGWIACTTDALFLEKPQYYDLVIDLTTSTPNSAGRPTLYMSKPKSSPSSSKANGRKKPGWKLETVRFTWSDARLWAELDRILKLDSAQSAHHPHAHQVSLSQSQSHNHNQSHSEGGLCLSCVSSSSPAENNSRSGAGISGAWADAFRLYEDVCMLCATLWMGLGTWRSNSRQSFESGGSAGNRGDAWGTARVPGDDDWSLEGTHMRTLGRGIEGVGVGGRKGWDAPRVRSLGHGIEGRPSASVSSTLKESGKDAHGENVRVECMEAEESFGGMDGEGERELQAEAIALAEMQNVQTTLALLQTFHANTVFWLSKLREVVPPFSEVSSPGGCVDERDQHGNEGEDEEEEEDAETSTITITARDLLALELGVLSDLDARFVEWLVEAEGYTRAGSRSARRKRRRRVVVKRGWQELFGIVLGLK